MMTLQQAIEEVKLDHEGLDYKAHHIDRKWDGKPSEAIATILNAVVKGELK